ncbi:MAG: lytic transglycosylase domain-containing protein [Bacteroidales bacterium]|nr:lytic transglycosylase domain-containing protein [Bacteroidales bacterium]
MQKKIYFIPLIITGLFTVSLICFILCGNAGRKTSYSIYNPLEVRIPAVPKRMTFSGEKVPLEYFDVRESLEKEIIVNTYFHSQTILNIKRSARYFPIIEHILKENNVPDDFKYLAVIESGLSNVTSPLGAKGYWQLLEGTATDYGLEVNDEVDERYHIEKSTLAACSYLIESYKRYKNWTLVAASYNTGRRGVDRQMERQNEDNYYDLLFNEETARYVYRILAIKLILENPDMFGFFISEDELYCPVLYKEIIVNGKIEDLSVFAKEYGTNYKILKFLNPWLRNKQLTNPKKKEYVIKIPLQGSREQ